MTMVPGFLFSILYLSFSIVFGVKLRAWDIETPGRCYNTSRIAASGDSHPLVDFIYLALTCMHCLLTLLLFFKYIGGAFVPGTEWVTEQVDVPSLPRTELQEYRARGREMSSAMILQIALIQYPLHLYMVIALRSSNEDHIGGDSENYWGFGQIVALALASATVFACVKGIFGE